jgi:hypothetical protein
MHAENFRHQLTRAKLVSRVLLSVLYVSPLAFFPVTASTISEHDDTMLTRFGFPLRRRCFATSISSSDLKTNYRAPSEYSDRSVVTQMLWDIRNRDSARLNPKDSAVLVAASTVDKKHSDSRVEIVLPFSSDPLLRAQYISPFGHVRIGVLLEDLDAIAANVAFLHADDGNPTTRPPTIVTASVDKLDLIPKAVDPGVDLKLIGGVSYVGSSSMEVDVCTNLFYFFVFDKMSFADSY